MTDSIPIMQIRLVVPIDMPSDLRAADLMPAYKSTHAAGLDLHYVGAVPLRLVAGHRRVFSTGVHVELPPGTMGEVRPRSGLSRKGLDVILGTVDEDYRGEIGVLMVNNSGDGINVQPGARIDVLAPGDRLSETDRGAKGWGSTGT